MAFKCYQNYCTFLVREHVQTIQRFFLLCDWDWESSWRYRTKIGEDSPINYMTYMSYLSHMITEKSNWFPNNTANGQTRVYRLVWGQRDVQLYRNPNLPTEDDDLDTCVFNIGWTTMIKPNHIDQFRHGKRSNLSVDAFCQQSKFLQKIYLEISHNN